MAKADSRSNDLKNAQILTVHNLGYIGYLTNNYDDIVTEKVFLWSRPINNKYEFIDNISGASFYVEEGQVIKQLIIKSLVLDNVVGIIDIDVTADTTGLMVIKNVYVEV